MPYGYIVLAVAALLFGAAVLVLRRPSRITRRGGAGSSSAGYEQARALSEINRHQQNHGGGGPF